MRALTQLIGQVLDAKYRIERQLGAGGMGAVFLATHLGTKRPVAIKVIVPQLMANAEFVARFRREAEAAGRLRHPNVVNVTDFGFTRINSEQIAYLVMEYLDGQTLSELLRRGQKLPLKFVVEIAEQICLAIDKAHQSGIIHRDLKPDNIWLEPNGRGGYNVKVLDFGLAKLRDPAPDLTPLPPPARFVDPDAVTESLGDIHTPTEDLNDAGTTTEDLNALETVTEDLGSGAGSGEAGSSSGISVSGVARPTQPHEARLTSEHASAKTDPDVELTRAGSVMGTPLYMSPEQCRGDKPSPASDLYSLGVIIYQMLAGETPFTGPTAELLRQHLYEEPPRLDEKRPDVPAPVAALVMSTLAKDPAQRPVQAAAFAIALRSNAEGESALLRESIAIYSDHFSTFLLIALVGFTPIMGGVAALALVGATPAWHTPLLSGAVFISLLAGLFIFNVMIGAVVTPLVARWMAAKPPQLGELIAALPHRLRAQIPVFFIIQRTFIGFLLLFVVYTMIPASTREEWRRVPASWIVFGLILLLFVLVVRRDQQEGRWLYAPIVYMEGGSAREVIERSRELVARLGGSFGTGRAIPLLVVAMLGSAVLAIMLGAWLLRYFEASRGMGEILTLLAAAGTILINTGLSIMLSPLLAIGIALFYLKARQAGGETIKKC